MAGDSVTVHGIGAGGVGVGRLGDGKVVFLSRTAPGDVVKVRLTQEKPRWARGEVLEWLKKGPGRRSPPCIRFAQCDGCALQHLDYARQLEWKGRLVGETLRRVGRLDTPDPPVVASPCEFRYRNKVTFTLRRLPGGRIVAGFREMARPSRVLDVGPECLLPEEILSATWEGLRASWGAGAELLPAGRELRLTLRRGAEKVGLLIRGGKGPGNPEALLGSVPTLGSIWKEGKGSKTSHLAGERALAVRAGPESLRLEGAGFLQVNEEASRLLFDYVLSQVGEPQGKRIIDAYCGVGALGRSLARAGGVVVGIETDPLPPNLAPSGDGLGFRVVTGLVEEELGAQLPADIVILNPPRAGLSASVPETLGAQAPPTVVYVSCDPATLARDLNRMEEMYRVESVKSFDLFPQTGHIETVATLKSTADPGGAAGARSQDQV